MQHPIPRPGAGSLRIRDEAEDRPATRRKVIAASLLGAVGIHAALAFAPLNFGGSAAEYGAAPGYRIEVTLMVEADEPAPMGEATAIIPPPELPPLDVAADMQRAAVEEPVSDVAQAAPPPRPFPPRQPTATKPVAASTPSARTAAAGERTMAKPDYLRNPPPQYPAESRELREEGVVLLKVSVSAAGRAAEVQLQRSSGYARLDEAALRAVRRWEFKPARVGLSAVACAVEVPVRFGLH